jgi:hypothetical protein
MSTTQVSPKVDNPSQRGDYVVTHGVKTYYMINPPETKQYTVTRIGVVRTLKRDGRPSRIEWLQGEHDFDRRHVTPFVSHSEYRVIPISLLREDVTIDDIENATKLRAFASWDAIKDAFRPFLKAQSCEKRYPA